MAPRPIFVATHPRACSTAFERVFMTRHDTLKCIHEPFGDAFYYGPERLGQRYDNDENARVRTGFNNSTYKTIFDRFDAEASEGKRLFIKDMAYYLLPPDGKAPEIVPSLQIKRGIGTKPNGTSAQTNGVTSNGTNPSSFDPSHHSNGEPTFTPDMVNSNPTVVPLELLSKFHFAFLIRDPHYSIPSYYRCTIPPLDKLTGFYDFYQNETGYDELRRLFNYLREIGFVGPKHASTIHDGSVTNGATNGVNGNSCNGSKSGTNVELCVLDADDLLDNPSAIIERFCQSVGEEYTPDMLNWETEKDQKVALDAFAKWPGFHEDAIASKNLRARVHKKKAKTEAEFDAEWKEKYGEKGAKIIRSAVDHTMEDYLYLKQFAVKI
ncbi:hypothetical protein FQN57_001819 [Myotisia sp. PD_48]|nr:hypothetical protein FQN57_001819 [Myotisia sp. PD_48]